MIAIYCFYQIHYQHYVAMPNSANMANKCKCGKSDQNVLPPTQSISNTKIGFTSCGETKMEKSVTNVYSAFTKTCSSPQTLYVRSYSFMHSTATHIIAVMFDVDFYFSFFFVSGKLHIENVQFVIEIAICGFVWFGWAFVVSFRFYSVDIGMCVLCIYDRRRCSVNVFLQYKTDTNDKMVMVYVYDDIAW